MDIEEQLISLGYEREKDFTFLHPMTCCMDILGSKQGYLRSVETMLPITSDGSPLPWYTYPAIEYFNSLNATGLNIFEFGSGQSSLYWANKGANVWCVEHDPEWFKTTQSKSSILKKITLCTQKKAYVENILGLNIKFDIIVIDGIWRNECAVTALERICSDGIIIVDNSDFHTDLTSFLFKKGYFPVDFSGFGPCNNFCWTTTIMLPFVSRFIDRISHPKPIGGLKTDHIEKGDQ